MSSDNYWTRWQDRRTSRRRWLQGAASGLAGAAAIGIVGCGDDDDAAKSGASPTAGASAAAERPVRGGTLKLVNYSSFGWTDFVDPAAASYVSSAYPSQLFYLEGLLDFSKDGAIVAGLAKEWAYDATGTELTLKLVDNAKFQDGTPVNAEAVRFTVERAIQKEGRPNGLLLPTILPKGVRVLDANTAVVTLNKPSPDFLGYLTSAFNYCPVSPTAYKTADDPWGFRSAVVERPITAGPFKLTAWEKNQSRRFERFDGYYKGAVSLDAIEERVVLEAAQRATLIRTGEAHAVNNIFPQDVASLKNEKSVNVQLLNGSRSVTATFNGLGVFGPDSAKTRLWRQAMMMGIDREAILKNQLLGIGRISDSPLLDFQDGFKSTKVWKYDPKAAKQQLQDNGFDFNHTVVMYFPSGGFTGDKTMTEAVQAMWQQIGLKVTLRQFNDLPTMYSTILQEGQNGSWDVDMIAWSMAPVSADRMFGLFNKDGSVNKNSITNYVDDDGQTDKLTNQIIITTDDTKRRQLMIELQTHIMDDLPQLPLFQQGFVWALGQKVKGGTPTILETIDLRRAWMAG